MQTSFSTCARRFHNYADTRGGCPHFNKRSTISQINALQTTVFYSAHAPCCLNWCSLDHWKISTFTQWQLPALVASHVKAGGGDRRCCSERKRERKSWNVSATCCLWNHSWSLLKMWHNYKKKGAQSALPLKQTFTEACVASSWTSESLSSEPWNQKDLKVIECPANECSKLLRLPGFAMRCAWPVSSEILLDACRLFASRALSIELQCWSLKLVDPLSQTLYLRSKCIIIIIIISYP